MTTVIMHFGDGSFKELEMTSDNPETAVQEAQDWVLSNAWFEVSDENGNMLATVNI
jgi:hypothetical protein